MTREEIIKGLDEELAARTKAATSGEEYTFEDYWEEIYGETISIWNSPLEMYNKAKRDYKALLEKLAKEEN